MGFTVGKKRVRRIARCERLLADALALLDGKTLLSSSNQERLRLVKEIHLALNDGKPKESAP